MTFSQALVDEEKPPEKGAPGAEAQYPFSATLDAAGAPATGAAEHPFSAALEAPADQCPPGEYVVRAVDVGGNVSAPSKTVRLPGQ